MKRKMITLATAILTLSLATACGSETPSTESTAANESVSVAVASQTSEDTSTSVEGSEESSVEPTEVVEESKSLWKAQNPDTYVPITVPYDCDGETPNQVMWISADGIVYFGYFGDLELTKDDGSWTVDNVAKMVSNNEWDYYGSEAFLALCKAYDIDIATTDTTSTEVLTAKVDVKNGMYALPEEELVNNVAITLSYPAAMVSQGYVTYGELTYQTMYETYRNIVGTNPIYTNNADEIYNPMVTSLNDLKHYSWTGTTWFLGARNWTDIDDTKNNDVDNAYVAFLNSHKILDSTGYADPKYGSITLHEKVTTSNGLVIAKNTAKIYEFDYNADLGNVPADLSTYKEIGTAVTTYRFYFKNADGNFNDLYYVSAYGSDEATILAAIDEYAAQYGLTQ